LQHTPSTQSPEEHSLVAVHFAPFELFFWQATPAQKAPEAQSPSAMQLAPHEPDFPLQTYGEQLGSPAEPFGTSVHAPSLDAPSDFAQTSHAPAQGLSQQTPSEQLPPTHSPEPPHESPSGFFARHAPPLQ